MRGRAAGALGRSSGRPVSAAMKRAISATLRAKPPTVSRLGASALVPEMATMPKLGLYPTTPQNDAGRMIEPAVWVPKASGTMKSATDAAEPLDEPPGVCAVLCGLRVLPGL